MTGIDGTYGLGVFPQHPSVFGHPTEGGKAWISSACSVGKTMDGKMPNEPSLYRDLAGHGTPYFAAANMSSDEWQEAVRRACKSHEYWLEALIREIGIEAVTEVFERVLLDLSVARAKLGD